jgi:hypothetical protein
MCSHHRTCAGEYLFWQKQKGWQVAQPSARTQNGALRKLAQKLPEQDNEPTIIDGLKAIREINNPLFASLSSAEETIPLSQPTFPDRHVSQFGRSAVSPPRPTLSQSAVRSGRQGKRAAAQSHAQPPLCGEHGEHGEHWTLMAAAHGATLDQAGCVQTSASASHNPYSASGSGSGKPIKKVDQRNIRKRDHAHVNDRAWGRPRVTDAQRGGAVSGFS